MLRLPALLVFAATACAAVAQPVPVPDSLDLFIFAGQSNAVGAGGDPALAPTPSFRTAYLARVVEDSVATTGEPFVELALVRPSSVVGGSAIPTFAVEYFLRTGRQTLFLQTAHGGTTNVAAADRGRGHWSALAPGLGAEGGPDRLALAIRDLDWLAEFGPSDMPAIRIAGLVWVQGETDALAIDDGRITAEAYAADLQATMAALGDSLDLRAGRPVPRYVVQIGRLDTRDSDGFAAVRAIQAERAAAGDYDLVCNHAVTFPANDLMADVVHWNQYGLNHTGFELAIAAAGDAPLLYTSAEDSPDAAARPRVLGNPARGAARFSAPVTGVVVDMLGREVARLDRALRTPALGPGAYAVRTADGPIRFTVAR